MTAIPNPLRDEEAPAWDTVTIGGVRAPGKAEIVGASDPRGWEETAGTGTTGATLRWKGDPLSDFTLKLTFWLPSHFDEWETFKPLVQRTPKGQKPKAYDIRHPVTDDLGIRAVVVTDRGQLTPEDDTGRWSVEIKLKRYAAPAPALGKPEKAEDASEEQRPEPKTAAEREIDKVWKEIEKEMAK